MSTGLYEKIGVNYANYRRPDPRIAAAIANALGDAKTLVNIGAGAGSYEPKDRNVIAVEPSETMIRQRRPGAAPVVCASAMALPFRDGAFEAATALLTVHHWPDPMRGLAEMTRVAKRCVVFSWEPSTHVSWLTRDYFPEIRVHDRLAFPLIADFYRRAFTEFEIVTVPVPHDCLDGFLEAYWRRPEAYFDPGVRRAISAFARIPDARPGLAKLKSDLADGTWMKRNGHLMELDALDLGYRLVIAER
jgi:ubiquinone/menaquinone biosynthesis C-methylase UbiE